MRSRRPVRSALLPGLLAVVALASGVGCSGDDEHVDGPGDDPSTPDDGAEPADSAAADPTALAGRTFLSDAVTEDGRPRVLVDGTQIELTFHDDGRVTADAGCNSIGAEVDVRPDRLVTGGASITEIGCDPALHEQDEWLADLLVDGPGYTLDGDRLQLTSGTTTIELVDRASTGPAVPLEETVWQLESLVDGDSVSSVPAGTGAVLQFSPDGVSVTVTGCNSGNASATAEGDTIVFGGLTSTLMACPSPAADVEAAVAAVLDGEVAYTLDDDLLTLTHPSGQGLVLRSMDE
jgi:heat shock protein HslJ